MQTSDRSRDILILAVTAYAEASSEGRDGVRAQVHSVVNRHREGQWDAGKTIAACCVKPYAYSAWNSKDPNRVRALSVSVTDPVMVMCMEEAELAISDRSFDPTGGATHYYVDGTKEPNWVSGKNDSGAQVAPPAMFTIKIGKHLFFKGVQ